MLRLLFLCTLIAVLPSRALAVSGASLAYRSSGSSSSGDWTLSQNGYLGTYITLASPGDVTVAVQASGLSGGGVAPHLNMVLDDSSAGFDVASGFNTYQHTFSLPAGTHFLRTEFNNDVPTTDRRLTIRNLDVTGAALNNVSSSANALSAADTYIESFRKGPAKVALVGVAPGTTNVQVRLKRHAFNFGANVPGSTASDINSYLGNDPTTTKDENFQEFINTHFNTLVPSNYGKWSNTEGGRDSPTMDRVDTLLSYAQSASHPMRVRMHALVWGDQNPSWVLDTNPNPDTGLFADALAGNETATQALRDEISERIDYYVGTGSATDRGRKYIELDVHNESLHKIGLWQVYGASGIASVFKEVSQTAAGYGPTKVKLYTNEFNVLQNSPASITPDTTSPIDPYNGVASGSDTYANWYRQNIDDIRNAGGDVSGVGVQYYPLAGHSPNNMQRAMQNLAVTGLPFSLTEFGAQSSVTDQALAADMVEETIRMVFGNPNAETFMYWGFWEGATSSLQSGSVMVHTNWKNADGTWNLTPAGQRYEWLFGLGSDPTKGTIPSPLTTNVTTSVNVDGTIDFTGYYGDYEITVNGQKYELTLTKGDALYSVVVAPGDYNADGHVDAADYAVWRQTKSSLTDLRADGDGNGVIDTSDYDVWRSHFGDVYATGASLYAAVPEPSAFGLILLGMATTFATCRRRRR